MSNIITDSWNTFSEEYSENYLYDADSTLPINLSKFIFEGFNNPKIVDIGCGNARLYDYFLNTKKEFSYSGFDISKPLVEAANKKFKKNSNFSCNVIDPNLANIKYQKFDIAICTHLVEICESPENLFSVMSNLSDTIAVIWYEYPRIENTQLEIRNYVSHDAQQKKIFTPYLRNRYSKYYLNYLLERFRLISSYKASISEKDVLEIYKKL